jgi:DNA-binding SARP family transcriptional activator
MQVGYTVLGRVGLTVDGAAVPVRGRRERSVLALLLAARRQVVSVDSFIEELWGAAATEGAQGSLQVAVSKLRGLIEPERAPHAKPGVLVSSGLGYALLASPGTVDSELFTSFVERAHTELSLDHFAETVSLCDEAAALWSGPPFGDAADTGFVRAESLRLEELRVGALEVRAEALLGLGRHAMVTGELEALVSAHPLRERLQELYALALYRSGRQGDALSALRQARATLADELGVDPSPELRRLEAAVLAQEPGLALPARGGAAPARIEPVPRPDRPALVGRAELVAVLEASLCRVVGGAGETVVVSGEAGIGKTRLVTELAESAEARGVRVLWGRCHEADVSPAYWPWVPVVRELAGARPSAVITELLAPTGAHPESNTDTAALRTYDAVSRLLAETSVDSPLLVVIEDVHWADTSSLRLLAYAAQVVRASRVLLVVTMRDAEVPCAALQACLGELGRQSAVRVPLRGLAPEHVRDLVGEFGGVADRELAEIVAARTDGNPFFVIELVRLLAAGQRLHAAGAREVEVPHGIQDVLRLRLAALPETVERLLRVAAVVGRRFELDVVCEVSGADSDDTLDLLDEAVGANLVEEEDRPGRYRFTHALVRETLTASLSLTRRGRLHAAVAVALESRLAADPELVTEVAHHFVLGAGVRPQLAEAAVRHSVNAARLAEGRGALDEALSHWEQALTAEGLAPAEEPLRRYEVLLGLGRARYRRGLVSSSREALDAAVALGRRLSDIELMAEAATSFRGAGVWYWREFGTSDPAMVAVLEECAAALPAGALRARSLASLAMELTYEWRSAEADDVSGRAVDVARPVGDCELLADVMSMRMLVLWGRPGAAEERLSLAGEVLAMSLSHEQELYTRFGAASAHLQLGGSDEADAQMTRCVELARRLRHTGADVPIAWWHFYRALAADDAERAGELARAAMELHRRSQLVAQPEGVPIAQSRLAGAGAPVSESHVALASTHANPAFRAFTGHVLAEAGRIEEAVAVLGDPVPDGAWDYASVEGDCLRVDVLAHTGPSDALRLALDRIMPWGHEFAVYGSIDYIGSIEYFIGRGLEGQGDLDGARAAYARAVERNRAARVVPWLRRAERRLAALG